MPLETGDTPSSILKQQYRNRFEQAERYRKQLWQVLCRNFFQQYVAANAVTLDLGCGWGEFINHINSRKKYAMDLNPDAASKLNKDIQFINQDCSGPWPVGKNSLDIVFTSNFLEHLPDKTAVEKTLDQAFQCLKPGGVIICMGPNINLLPGSYWDFWDHHVPISDQSLTELLTLKGFEIDKCLPGFLPYTMSNGKNPKLFLVKLYLKLSIAWRIMGKQFLIIARKR